MTVPDIILAGQPKLDLGVGSRFVKLGLIRGPKLHSS